MKMPQKNNREYRNMVLRALEDAPEEEKRVTGYASTFNEPYLLWEDAGWEYWETVDTGAFDTTDMDDVIFQYNHEGRVFARTKNNTLVVSTDDKGLLINADLGGTAIGRELYDEISGGYTDKMSFGFTVNGETEEREKDENGIVKITRHITSVEKLYDVSAVSLPANPGTSIDATTRSISDLTDGVIERVKAERLEEERTELERLRAEVRAKALLGGNK